MDIYSFYEKLCAMEMAIREMKNEIMPKITLRELLDADENIKNVPGTAIMQACAGSNVVEQFDYDALNSEFCMRNWVVLVKKDFKDGITQEQYIDFKRYVLQVIYRVYNAKFGLNNKK